MQMVTYGEFLPLVIGKSRMSFFNLHVQPGSSYTSYNPNINPSIYTEFATAAFRFGHTLISPVYSRVKPNGAQTEYWLKDNYFNPHVLKEGDLDNILRGMTASSAARSDPFIADDVRNHLYKKRDEGFGSDLIAFNIQRGRDHGMPDSYMPRQQRLKLQSMYANVNDIDLFTGGVSEYPMPDGHYDTHFILPNLKIYQRPMKNSKCNFSYSQDGAQNSIDCREFADSKFRSPDGSCNNLKHPFWGKSSVCHIRLVASGYEDGISEPRQNSFKYGRKLPTARHVSQAAHYEKPDRFFYTLMVMAFGQFLNHDITFTPQTKLESKDSIIDCCKKVPGNKKAKYLDHLKSLEDKDSFLFKYARGYEDYLQIPLQPLNDNLESMSYEVFEKDPVKYVKYKEAICEALISFEKEEIILIVVGAGRGPLVTASIEAAFENKKKLKLFAIEKNGNAIPTLNYLKNTLWIGYNNVNVEIICEDMRNLKMNEKADIVVSELLGSLGDNELSPECLDGLINCTDKNTISIPQSYSSYLAPIMSYKLYSKTKANRELDKPIYKAFENQYKGNSPVHYIAAHLQKIYGLDWHPSVSTQLATCSQDNTSNNSPYHTIGALATADQNNKNLFDQFGLKLGKFREFREIDKYPTAVCPSKDKPFDDLIKPIIDQVIKLHKESGHDLKYIHIGCDEVFHIGHCDLCRSKDHETLYLSHVKKVAEYVKTNHQVIPIIWDDMLRNIYSEKIKEYGLGNLVEPMVWTYIKDIYR
ncbi:hypothetical protein RND71_043630 [Anisodus tanguticus]|uniref:PRMT5 arginine-N-methyltransferase domain-containing protein n=1 Tax=Anisodus tanguticus TaxID=243964 RepID=A0AAE1UTM5_9SOLA|nr:hypothetical protein RND71_043630 [Anisodus tanguticus]